MARKSLWAALAAGALVALPSPALAEEVDIGHQQAGEVKESCENNGGAYWEVSGGMYGCIKDCPGETTCGVICDEEKGCLGYTPESRVQTTRDPNALVSAINGTLKAEQEERGDFEWGLLGLLGLLGLTGLAMRNRSPGRADRT